MSNKNDARSLREAYTTIVPHRTKEHISNILKNFDFNDINTWYYNIAKYVNNPFGECWLGNENAEYRINSILKYFQFLKKVNLLGELYNYYINNVVKEDDWIIILSSWNECSPPNKNGKPTVILEPQDASICDATIRELIIKDIDKGTLKVYPAGKIKDNGKLIFFEYEDIPVVVENDGKPLKSLEDLMIDSMDQALLNSFNDNLVSGLQKLILEENTGN